jgi:hypothetical protein
LGATPLSKLIEGLDKEAVAERETKFESKKGSAWIRVRASRERVPGETGLPRGRILVDCALESSFPPSRAAKRPPHTAEEVDEFLQMLSQESVSLACCEGFFQIPEERIPKRGFVGLMLDFSASVGKAEMNLTGATFDIQGHKPYEELRWKRTVTSGKNGEDRVEVEVRLTASPDADAVGGCLEQVAGTLSAGIEELVIEVGN